MELIELVKKAQTGDADAQGALYEKTYRRAYYLALRLTRNPEDAQDAAQDAFISAFQALPNLREPNAFEGWLFQIVANKCRNRIARSHNDEELPEGFEEHEPDPQEDLIPEDALQSAEKRRLILQIIDDLPDLQRECVMLFYYSEMSVKQIARTLECSEGTVKSRLNYARQKLREGILETEKREDIRLHTFIPFGLFFAKDFVLSMAEVTTAAVGGTAAVAASTGGAAAGSSSAGTAAGTVKAGLLATAKAKVIAGITAAAIVTGGGAAVVSQMPKAIAFSDPAMEQNIRVLVDKPEGKLYADDLNELYSLWIFDDGMALLRDPLTQGTEGTESLSGTVPVENLADLALFPNDMALYYVKSDVTALQTLAPGTKLHILRCLGTQDYFPSLSDLSFLDHITDLRDLDLNVAPGTDLSPIERQTSLEILSLLSCGSLRLQVDGLQNLRILEMSANWDGTTPGAVNQCILTQELPQLRELCLRGGTTPTLDILNHTPALLSLELGTGSLEKLDLTPLSGLQQLRVIFLEGGGDAVLDLAPLSACPALEVYCIPYGQYRNPPPQAITDTEPSLPNFNRVAREVRLEQTY
ncbi:MAG: sigma-70 family RNA polymerase sigma factor [Oscillospiraceae bacterium]